MIHLVSSNFYFNSQLTELNIDYDDLIVGDINQFLKDNNQIEHDAIFYIKKNTKILLNSEQLLSQQGIEKQDDIILYVEYCPHDQVFIKFYIDNKFQLQDYVSLNSTCHDFLQSKQNDRKFSIIELRDKEGNIISTEMFKPFHIILKPSHHYDLYVYTSQETQNPFLSILSQQQEQPTTQENSSQTTFDPIDAIDQLVILPKMSIWIDREGTYIIYKFHPPLLVKGVLKMSKGIAYKNEDQHDFVTKFGLKFAQIDQDGYAYVIKWPNGTYNSIQIKLM